MPPRIELARELAVILTAVVRAEASITLTVDLTFTVEEVLLVIVKIVESVFVTPLMLTADKLAALHKVIFPSPTVTIKSSPLFLVE